MVCAMMYRLLANLVVMLHLAFILFATFGALLVWWRKRWVWIHLPCVVWAVLIEWVGWTCPLTPLENWLWHKAGLTGYHDSFAAHYLLPLIYPTWLTPSIQFVMGALVLAINVAIYIELILCGRNKPRHLAP